MVKIAFLLFIGIYSFSFAQELSVEKIWKEYQFFGASVEGFRSMKDGVRFTQRRTEGNKEFISIYRFEQPEKKVSDLLELSGLSWNNKSLVVDEYQFNDDESKVLLETQVQSIYRRSYQAVYYTYDLNNKKLQPLDEKHQPQMYAQYSPDGLKVSYVYKNDIFVKDLASGKITKLTDGGKRNKIINGATDWVYEEEFAIAQAYAWSPDSKYIAYLQFNEKEVKEYNLTYYGDLYPELYTYKYPKAGEDNSVVKAKIVDLKKGKSVEIELPQYEYLPRLNWSKTQNQLILQTLNRHQNHLKYHLVEQNGKVWKAKLLFEEKSNTYIEIDDNLILLKDGKTLLRTSESSGFRHIQALGFDGLTRAITQGNYDVNEFLGVDEEQGLVFFTAAKNSAIDLGIYAVSLQGGAPQPLSKETGHHQAVFSSGMKYFMRISSDANTPPTFTLCNQKGEEIVVLEDNTALKSRIAQYKTSSKTFRTVQGAAGLLNAWVILPTNFDANKKYPVYLNIYGGPGSNTVENKWDGANYMYHQLLAQKGYIVLSVDPRGTMNRGVEFKKSTYLQLGKLETEDFIAAAKDFAKEPYVDAGRIGIQGWSYGGFMSSLCITKGADVFKMAIAVAPVTSWRYYDNIYTERFMRTPAENAKGYDDNSPINFVNQLKGKYLLIHGSTDDNVHYQNTMDMITALVKANKQFDSFIYPNKNHGIYGGNTRNHLFNMMLNYTLQNL